LKDSNTTVGVKNLLRWGSNLRPLEYKAGVFTILCFAYLIRNKVLI
jgi:hypothetical protein